MRYGFRWPRSLDVQPGRSSPHGGRCRCSPPKFRRDFRPPGSWWQRCPDRLQTGRPRDRPATTYRSKATAVAASVTRTHHDFPRSHRRRFGTTTRATDRPLPTPPMLHGPRRIAALMNWLPKTTGTSHRTKTNHSPRHGTAMTREIGRTRRGCCRRSAARRPTRGSPARPPDSLTVRHRRLPHSPHLRPLHCRRVVRDLRPWQPMAVLLSATETPQQERPVGCYPSARWWMTCSWSRFPVLLPYGSAVRCQERTRPNADKGERRANRKYDVRQPWVHGHKGFFFQGLGSCARRP
jgi:hypothetical protein